MRDRGPSVAPTPAIPVVRTVSMTISLAGMATT